MRMQEHTNDVVEVSANPTCQLFQQHSLHLEDLVCWQIQEELHPAAHP